MKQRTSETACIRLTECFTRSAGKKTDNKFYDLMKNGLHELFLEELADIYHAEQQLSEVLPEMAMAAANEDLRAAFKSHLQETENHISRVEQVFESLGEKPRKKKCKGIQGIIKESKDLLADNKNAPALDAAIISAAQKAEHYEIASYGCLCTWAELLDHQEAFRLLQETLNEEKDADEKLTGIAKGIANLEAVGQQ